MRLPHTFVTLSLIGALAVCTAGQDASPNAQPVQEPAPAKVAGQIEEAVSLEALKERSEYAALDKQAVEALARAAVARWPQEFSGFT